jgi:hypothetical protein
VIAGPFTYYRGLDGEADLDVTPGDREDIPKDRCHHHEVPCRGQLPWQLGSTTASMVPPIVLQLRLDWSFPRGIVVLVTATLPGSFLPSAPSGASSLEDVSAREASLRGPVPTRALAPGGLGSAPQGPAPGLAPVLAVVVATRAATPVPSSSLGAALPSGIEHYAMSNHIQILDCIN